jgi:SAM-dependent methyltransferase
VTSTRSGSNLLRFYPESHVGGFSNVDGTVAFYSRVNALLSASSVVVDFGCGRGAYLEDEVAYRRKLRVLKGKAARVIGLDIDPNAAGNRAVDEVKLLSPQQSWPIASESADLVLADFVVEHLTEPARLFSEAGRVLRRGGVLCIRTSNVLSYVAAAAVLLPGRLHGGVLRKAQPSRKASDVFPAVYRCNTVYRLRRALRDHGFAGVVYGIESEPQYLDFSSWMYPPGRCLPEVQPDGVPVFDLRVRDGWAGVGEQLVLRLSKVPTRPISRVLERSGLKPACRLKPAPQT